LFILSKYSAFLILISFVLHSCKERTTNTVYDTVGCEIVGNAESGWGYVIYVNGKALIDQPTIPAVGGNQKFQDSHQAKKVGSLVIEKLNNGESPAISIRDLENLNIQFIKY